MRLKRLMVRYFYAINVKCPPEHIAQTGHLSRSRRRGARPGYSFRFASGSQQLVHTADKLVRIFQRAALGQQRLIQQQFHPFAELRVVPVSAARFTS